jgi:hypothetical protein
MNCKIEDVTFTRFGQSFKGVSVDAEGTIEIGDYTYSFNMPLIAEEVAEFCDLIKRVEARIINDVRMKARGEA